jgi:hypothetical protein
MAMKPAGKAIVAALVVLGAIAGAHFGGVFDKLKKQGETVQTAPIVEQVAPASAVVTQPEPVAATPVAPPAPTSIPQPINSPVRQADALDQLIRQSGTK